ncbi:Peptidase M48 [Trypanosoma melophagium]|uniref:Peptidase M48 n=1 Tax=Trypanosoma melophagium TaxID=715481 RepID=UPI00351A5611|nr:Peptidase M48 [Trypanosoma melophagium]
MYRLPRTPFYASALVGVNVVGVWELYLEFREWKTYFCTKIPSQFADSINEEEFLASQAYSRDKALFGIVCHVKDLLFSNLVMVTKLPSKMYNWVAKSAPVTVGSFKHCCTYAIVWDLISTMIEIPFRYYGEFVIEQKHGFNKMTVTEFVKDEIKMLLLRVFLLHPIMTALVLEIANRFGEKFPFYFFLLATGILTSFTFVYPALIQPLFNKYTPIPEDSNLYVKISKLAKLHDFPLNRVYEVDGSRRSSHSNAYVYGFWKNKQIVLYDTLIKQMEGDDDALLSVLCHELGHWKYAHSHIMLGMGIAQLFCISFGAKEVIFNPEICKQFGFNEPNPFIGFQIFLLILEPFFTPLAYAVSLIVRRFEFQADQFAVKCGYGPSLERALIVMQKENKIGLTPDPLFAALKYSHPPLVERIDAIKTEVKKKE